MTKPSRLRNKTQQYKIMQYLRAQTEGETYFFTVVTNKRRQILCQSRITLLREAFGRVMEKFLFTIDAFVLLPEHLYCMWTLPNGDRDFSKRWRLIKSCFSIGCDDSYRNAPSASRQKKKEQAVWQRRFFGSITFGMMSRVGWALPTTPYAVWGAIPLGHSVTVACPNELRCHDNERMNETNGGPSPPYGLLTGNVETLRRYNYESSDDCKGDDPINR